MTKNIVTDEQKLVFQRRQHELAIRFLKGVLNPDLVNSSLQMIIEGAGIGFYESRVSDIISDWQSFWHNITGQEYNFSSIRIPARPEGHWRLLVCIDISLETLYAECQKRFACWRWTNKDLDKIVVQNERTAQNGPYAIWVKDEIEADENLKNLSSNDIKNKNLTTETLAERLTHELKYFQETGKHLDIQNITLCAGSRYVDGVVPSGRWDPYYGRLDVYWYSPDHRHDALRSRPVS